jgi:hypothetical protein
MTAGATRWETNNHTKQNDVFSARSENSARFARASAAFIRSVWVVGVRGIPVRQGSRRLGEGGTGVPSRSRENQRNVRGREPRGAGRGTLGTGLRDRRAAMASSFGRIHLGRISREWMGAPRFRKDGEREGGPPNFTPCGREGISGTRKTVSQLRGLGGRGSRARRDDLVWLGSCPGL